jgi:hypothetical protein
MDEINGRGWKIRAFDHYAIPYPLTPKGNPSFTSNKMQGWMPNHPHWLPRLIAIANKYEAAGTKFIEGHILAHVVNGRIHAEIHPLRAEEGGARSSRFSYSDPPLQQMPKHDEELAPLIRRVFLPEQGEVLADPDIRQHDFRWMVEYAARMGLRGARATARIFHDDPKADFHAIVAEMAGLTIATPRSAPTRQDYGQASSGWPDDGRRCGGAGHPGPVRQESPFSELSVPCGARQPARLHRRWTVPAGTGRRTRRRGSPRAPDPARSRRPGGAATIQYIRGIASGCADTAPIRR